MKLINHRKPLAIGAVIVGTFAIFQNATIRSPLSVLDVLSAERLGTLESDVSISGISGTSPSYTIKVNTGKTLKVTVAPLPAPHLPVANYGGWVFPYGCASVEVRVNGNSQRTQLLQVAGVKQAKTSPCLNNPTQETLDLSTLVNGGSAGPSHEVDVVISNAEYDNCRTSNPSEYGCAMSSVWQNQITEFKVQTQYDLPRVELSP